MLKIFYFCFACTAFIQLWGNKNVEALLSRADAIYWFAMEESGNADALRDGLAHLKEAEEILAETPNSSLQSRLSALKVDLLGQLSVSEDTTFGKLPLLRFCRGNLFQDNLTLGTYELVDQPDERAVVSASRNLADLICSPSWRFNQLDLLLFSKNQRHELENEAAYIFNQYDRFWLHNRSELVGLLGESEVQKLYESGNWNKGLSKFIELNGDSLATAFGNPYLLVARINLLNEANATNRLCHLEGQLWNLSKPTNSLGTPFLEATFSSYGLARNRNHLLVPFGLLFSFCLIIILGVHFLNKRNGRIDGPAIVHSFIPFFCGLLVPAVLAMSLSRFLPEPSSLWWLSVWWPILLFGLSMVMPMCLLFLLRTKFPKNFRAFDLNLLNCGLVVTLGLACYLASNLIIYSSLPSDPLSSNLLIMISALFTAIFCFQNILLRVLQGKQKWNSFSTVLGFAGIIGPTCWGYWTAGTHELLAGALISSIALFKGNSRKPILSEEKNRLSINNPNSVSVSSNGECPDLTWLRKQCVEPGFVKMPNFYSCKEFLQVEQDSILLVSGGVGVGKNRLTEELFSKVASQASSSKLFSASCNELSKSDANIPFLLCRDMFGHEIFPNDLDEGLQQFSSSVIGLIPILGFAHKAISESSPDASGFTIDRTEKVSELIQEAILQLVGQKEASLFFFVQNLEAIDPDSDAKILQDLILWNPPETKVKRKTFVFTAKNESALLDFVNSKSLNGRLSDYEIQNLRLSKSDTLKTLQKLLSEKLLLDSRISEQVLANVVGDEEGCIDWVLDMLDKYCRDLEIVPGKNGKFQIAEGTSQLSPPHRLKEEVFRRLISFDQYREIIRLASMLGGRFRASTLAHCLNSKRSDVLRELEKIEEDCGLLQDLHKEDDVFQITPTKLKYIKEFFQVTEDGPFSNRVPQVVRENHAMVAKGYEKLEIRDLETLGNIANHFYFAGKSYASSAIQYNLLVAEGLSLTFQFDGAHKRLGMAEEYAEGRDDLLKLSKARISVLDRECSVLSDLEKSEKRLKVCEEFLAHNDDLDIEVITLRARHELAMEDALDAKRKKELWRDNLNACERLLAELAKGTNSFLQRREIIHFTALSQDKLCTLESGLSKQDREKILSVYEGALEELKAETDKESLGLTSRIQDSLARFHGKFEDSKSLTAARLYYEQSIKTKRELDDKQGLAMSLSGLSEVYFKDKEAKKQGLKLLAEAVEFNLEIGSNEWAARGLLRMAEIQEPDEAKESIARIRETLGSWEYKDSEDVEGILKDAEKIESDLV